MTVAKNPLLLSFVAAIFVLLGLSFTLDHPWMAFAGAAAQLAGGAVVSWVYTADAVRAVFNPKFRDPENPNGSHHLVIGGALLAWGQIYAGTASLLFIYAESPQDWLSNNFFYGGRFITAWGFYHIYKAAKETPKAYLSFRPSLAVAILFIVTAVVMFIFGTRVGHHVPTSFEGTLYRGAATYPQCQEDEPIWVSSTGRFHGPDSPDRLKIRGPSRCFRTEHAAKLEGFIKAQN